MKLSGLELTKEWACLRHAHSIFDISDKNRIKGAVAQDWTADLVIRLYLYF